LPASPPKGQQRSLTPAASSTTASEDPSIPHPLRTPPQRYWPHT